MNIPNLQNRIREFINGGRVQSKLLKNIANWNKLCSSLDLVGDSQLAIDAYPQFHSVQDVGANYLLVYGILQSLLLQQDAVKHIGDSFDIKVKLPKDLVEIRVIRNCTAGHPTFQKEKGLSKSCFVTRNSMSPTNFQLMTVYSDDKEYEFRQISISFLIREQRKYLSELLEKVVVGLERQEMEHREKHKSIKLVDIFPQAISYHFGKIYEATSSEGILSVGLANLQVISTHIDKFKDELSRRGELGVAGALDYCYELIDYPLQRLNAYFVGNDDLNSKDAYIFTSFIDKQVKSLKELAKELDDMYEPKPKPKL